MRCSAFCKNCEGVTCSNTEIGDPDNDDLGQFRIQDEMNSGIDSDADSTCDQDED